MALDTYEKLESTFKIVFIIRTVEITTFLCYHTYISKR